MIASIAVAEAAEIVLLEESFSDDAVLRNWNRPVRVTTGDGATSSVSIREGAMVFSAEEDVRRFRFAEHSLRVVPEAWLHVKADLRAEIGAAGPLGIDAGVYALFPRRRTGVRTLAGVVGTQQVSADAWVQVPPGTRVARLGAYLIASGAAWLDSMTVTQGDGGFVPEEVGHFRYHVLEGDRILAADKAYNEESHRLVSEFFDGVKLPTVDYFKFPSTDVKGWYTGDPGNAHSAMGNIYTIWGGDRHEIVHLASPRWGDPPPLLNEGVAVYLSHEWQLMPVSDFARGLVERQEWVPLSSILDSEAFHAQPATVTYGEGGALVRWIVAERGSSCLKKLFQSLRAGSTAEENSAHFSRVVGKTLDEVDELVRDQVAPR